MLGPSHPDTSGISIYLSSLRGCRRPAPSVDANTASAELRGRRRRQGPSEDANTVSVEILSCWRADRRPRRAALGIPSGCRDFAETCGAWLKRVEEAKRVQLRREKLTKTERLLEDALSFMGKDVVAFHAEVHTWQQLVAAWCAEREDPTAQPAKRQKKS